MATFKFTLLLIVGIVLLLIALLLLFKPKLPSVVFAFSGMLALHFGGHIYLTNSALATWSIITLIIGWLHVMQPKDEPKWSKTSNLFINLGSIAGLLVGMAIDARVMLLCLCAGCVFGFITYTKTPSGAWLKFPTFTFIQYFCAKCFPSIATIAMMGIAIEGFIID